MTCGDTIERRTPLSELTLFDGFDDIGPGLVPDAISKAVDIDHWILMNRLLWPVFVQYRGGVFIDVMFHADAADEWLQGDWEIHEVERTVNHIHIWDLVEDATAAERMDECQEIAEVIARMWECCADSTLPEANVNVGTERTNYGPVVYLTSGAE